MMAPHKKIGNKLAIVDYEDAAKRSSSVSYDKNDLKLMGVEVTVEQMARMAWAINLMGNVLNECCTRLQGSFIASPRHDSLLNPLLGWPELQILWHDNRSQKNTP